MHSIFGPSDPSGASSGPKELRGVPAGVLSVGTHSALRIRYLIQIDTMHGPPTCARPSPEYDQPVPDDTVPFILSDTETPLCVDPGSTRALWVGHCPPLIR